MAFSTRLYFDITNNKFVQSVEQPSPVNPPTLFADDTKHLLIQFVERTSVSTVSVVSGVGITLQLAIGDPATSPTVDTSATAGAADASHTFTVDLPLNVTPIQTALGANKSVTRILEFRTSDATGSQRYQIQVPIFQRLITGTLADPAPPAVAISGAEALATFVPRDGSNSTYPCPSFIMVDEDNTALLYKVSVRAGELHAEPLQ
jgi:hypothetical protein